MSKYTSEQVEKKAKHLASASCFECSGAQDMLLDLARRLRQEEEENRRDPVTDPKAGDRMITPCGWEWVCIEHEKRSTACSAGHFKQECEKHKNSTIIRRREVTQ